MNVFYNENDKFASRWLEELCAVDLIPKGTIDTRSIHEIERTDLLRFGQAHFFAGIGGWPLALRLLGWPPEQAVWTGSCPCQPFSVAGKKKGKSDERHLWPIWRELISQCRPPIVFGEQVASPDGRRWFSELRVEMEKLGYGVGGADLCAAGFGAPHQRQRLFFGAVWLGNTYDERLQGRKSTEREKFGTLGRAASRRLLNAFWKRRTNVLCRDGKTRPIEPGIFPLAHGVPARVGRLRGYGNAIVPQVAANFILSFIDAMSENGF